MSAPHENVKPQNTEALRDFLKSLFCATSQGAHVIKAIGLYKDAILIAPSDDLDCRVAEAMDFAAAHAQEDLYLSPYLFPDNLPVPRTHGKDDEATGAYVINLDTDTANLSRLPPWSYKIETSRGHFHVGYVLDKPCPVAAAKAVAAALVALVHCDGGDKPIRLPGTLNFPNPKKIAEGRPPDPQEVKLVSIVDPCDARSLEDLQAAIVAKGGSIEPEPDNTAEFDWNRRDIAFNDGISNAKIAETLAKPQYKDIGKRSEGLAAFYHRMRIHGRSPEDIFNGVLDQPESPCMDHVLEKASGGDRGMKWLRSDIQNWWKKQKPIDQSTLHLQTGSHVEIAERLIDKLQAKHGQIVYAEGAVYFYDDRRWSEMVDNELQLQVHAFDGARFGDKGIVKLTQGTIKSILDVMKAKCADPEFFREPAIGINCASGFIQFDAHGTPTLVAHDRDHRHRHVIDCEWHPGARADAPLLNKLVRGCFKDDADQRERIMLLGQICGCAALGYGTRLTQPKVIALHGPLANNGKSELLKIIKGLLPASAVCSVSFDKFNNDPMLMQLRGKTLNAVAEMGGTHAIASDVFKSVVTGESRTGRSLYKDPAEIVPIALHVCATNTLPPFQGGFDNGVYRRLIVLLMNRVIPADERVPQIGDRIVREERPALLAFAVRGASLLIKFGGFTEPASCRAALDEWRFSADAVAAWLNERVLFASFARLYYEDARKDFREWAIAQGHNLDHMPGPGPFSQRVLRDSRISKSHNNDRKFYIGISLRPTQAQLTYAGSSSASLEGLGDAPGVGDDTETATRH